MSQPTFRPALHPQVAAIEPALIIFDKDGTLIDFAAMWAGWLIGLARRLEAATDRPLADRLFAAMDFTLIDPLAGTGHIAPAGELAVTPMAGLATLTRRVLGQAGLVEAAVEAAMRLAWQPPDPIALARPVADLPRLFAALRGHGLTLAVATSDDHQAATGLLAHLDLAEQVAMVLGGDDGLPLKPAPAMIEAICRSLAIAPRQSVMVGDNTVDLEMGRAAGVGLTVGVLSGVGSPADLAGQADLILPTVAGLIQF
jgi:phosphoglycolate phosphatase-like HAD superfamily hydrolase